MINWIASPRRAENRHGSPRQLPSQESGRKVGRAQPGGFSHKEPRHPRHQKCGKCLRKKKALPANPAGKPGSHAEPNAKSPDPWKADNLAQVCCVVFYFACEIFKLKGAPRRDLSLTGIWISLCFRFDTETVSRLAPSGLPCSRKRAKRGPSSPLQGAHSFLPRPTLFLPSCAWGRVSRCLRQAAITSVPGTPTGKQQVGFGGGQNASAAIPVREANTFPTSRCGKESGETPTVGT